MPEHEETASEEPEEGSILKFPSPKEEISPNEVPEESEEKTKETDIIRPDFSKSKKKKDGFKKPKMTHGFYIPPEDVDRAMWNESIKKTEEILNFLWSLKGRVSEKVYHDSRVEIQNFSSQILVEIILNSSNTDWKKKPAYYKALADEMFTRALNPDENE